MDQQFEFHPDSLPGLIISQLNVYLHCMHLNIYLIKQILVNYIFMIQLFHQVHHLQREKHLKV